MIITTNVPPHELYNLMDLEIETRYHEAIVPSRSIAKIADSLFGDKSSLIPYLGR